MALFSCLQSVKHEEVSPMSVFPTKILVATDGSEDSQLAARTAVELAQKTSSELHVVYVVPWPDVGVRDL
jgi:K+-sensing histidine kinase KdpD